MLSYSELHWFREIGKLNITQLKLFKFMFKNFILNEEKIFEGCEVRTRADTVQQILSLPP